MLVKVIKLLNVNLEAPSQTTEVIPWKSLCIDVIVPYTMKGTDNFKLDFMCLTIIDPATSWFEIVEIPTVEF